MNNNQVVSRHAGVVGKPDRPSPLLQSAIEEINFNKEWIVPPTVLKADLVPKGRDGQDVLAKYKIDAYADFAAYQKGHRHRSGADRLVVGSAASLFLCAERWRG